MTGNKRLLEFVLTILATVAVAQSLTYMIPQGGWMYLLNFSVGLVILTVQANQVVKRIK